MAAEPIYIESDEEIPEIIDRLRRSAGTEISLMLPSHSRLGQSRFNFRLLQEYATRLGKRVMIISPDPAIQEMAAETGLGAGAPAVGAVGSAPPPIGAFGSPAPPMAAAGLAGAAFVPSPVVPVDAAPSRIHFSAGAAPASALAGLRPGRTGLYVGALLVLVAGILGMVFYVPSASITLVAQAKPFSAPVTLDAAPGSGSIKVRTSNDSQSTTASFKATGTFT
ncbi:MAG TPA: hypothetical protein VNI34_10160, partial [Candidatus Nitrosotalea sp.]|nr:hypothetical protein [Candidatus Nitrosotalea sp.]